MIEAIDLTVRRRGRTVLDAVSFDVRPGQVTGMLGGTGAGKSVLLRRMVQLERGRGETLFDGRTYRSLRRPMREVGLLLDPPGGDPDRTVRNHLRLALATDPGAARSGMMNGMRGADAQPHDAGDREPDSATAVTADAAGIVRAGRLGRRDPASRRARPGDRIDAVLDIVGLSGQSRTRLSELTEGMSTRLGIAVALLGDPAALLLDCPDRGLEPEGLAWLAALLRAFTAQGRAALVTGSDTETLVAMVDRVLLLDAGYLVGTRTAQEVLRAPTGAVVVVRSPQVVRLAAILAEAGARSTQSDGACLEVRGLDRARVGDLAFRHGIPVHELSERFTGSDPADLVLAACMGRRARPVFPPRGVPDGRRAPGVVTPSGSVRLVPARPAAAPVVGRAVAAQPGPEPALLRERREARAQRQIAAAAHTSAPVAGPGCEPGSNSASGAAGSQIADVRVTPTDSGPEAAGEPVSAPETEVRR
ncbi:ATP-binding cassette domain-containing protein [Actinocrinis puniceicyclus]|uniref:ATP-binding cassette domain-containing protein n=1 Tax=Actinocrinis puniceicyclus TaxID=977794 RepID=A0A8J8BEW3_9ACTN|nr:ATP-binding cassette domain-containing protein [Actinocrinis puniceicyclus]MBS2966010.1 ATP-binding cassette domain-containing protein [Actinocrinis puniceicyclus]